MKNKFYTLIASAILLLVTLSLSSCGGEKYPVWTDSESYSTFYSSTNIAINDGQYMRAEISNSEWKDFGKSLSDEYKHRWDEATIKKWLISNGFGDYESTKESSWLVLTNHGMIVSRTGSMVYMIVK